MQSNYLKKFSHVILGIEYATLIGWFNWTKFSSKQYFFNEKLENGDLNWVIPNKMLAFSSPYDDSVDPQGFKLKTPKEYIPIFRQLGVKVIIRLNRKTYDETV